MNSYKCDTICHKVIEYIIYIILLMPLIPASQLIIFYNIVRIIIFNILIELLLIVYLILIFQNKKYRPNCSRLLMALCVWLGFLLISTFAGVNSYLSFFGDLLRVNGVLNIAHFIVLFIVSSSVFGQNIDAWRKFFYVSLFSSLLNSLFAFGQYLDIFNSNIFYSSGQRVFGTIGNSAFFASYLLFHIFLALKLFFDSSTYKRKSIYLFIFAFEIYILLLTGTRGALVGLIAGLIMTWIFLLRMDKTIVYKILPTSVHINIRLVLIFIPVLFLAILLFISMTSISHPAVQHLTSWSLNDETIRNRIIFSKIAISGFKERPLLGFGEENFYIVSDKYFDPVLFTSPNGEVLADRPHNFLLERLVNGGIFGLISYLAIFIILFRQLYLLYDKKVIDQYNKAILNGMFIGYFVQNLFLFDTFVSHLMFFILLGYVDSLSTSQESRILVPKYEIRTIVKRSLLIVVLIFIFFVMWTSQIKSLIAISYLQHFKNEASGADIAIKIKSAIKAHNAIVDLNPINKVFFVQYVTRTIADSINISLKTVDQKDKQIEQFQKTVLSDLVMRSFDQAWNGVPSDFWQYYYKGVTYNILSRIDKSFVKNAEQELSVAFKQWPTRPDAYIALIQTKNLTRDNKTILELSRKLIELNPQSRLFNLNLAYAYLLNNQSDMTKTLLRFDSKEYGINYFDQLTYVVGMYAYNPDYERSISFYEIGAELIESKQDKALLLVQIGTSYNHIGNMPKAKIYIRKALVVNPAIKNDIRLIHLIRDIYLKENMNNGH